MKFKIRRSIFETNSSSVHSIVICDFEKQPCEEVILKYEPYIYSAKTIEEKINYIYTMCVWYDSGMMDYHFMRLIETGEANGSAVFQFIKYLKRKGIKASFDLENRKKFTEIYIEVSDYDTFFEQIFKDSKFNEELLDKFIFNSYSKAVCRDNNYADNPIYTEIKGYTQIDFYD